MTLRRLPALAAVATAALLAAACEPRTVTPEQAERDLRRPTPLEDLPIISDQVSAERAVAWVCDRDMPVTAIHGRDTQGRPSVALIIQGFNVNAVQTPAASGARYEAEMGVQRDFGVVWWERGEEALLQEWPLGTSALETAVTKRTCRVRGRNAPPPPVPGTVAPGQPPVTQLAPAG